jgi:carbohydrate-selective porin OprB
LLFRHKFLFARLTVAGLISVTLMPAKAARAEETRENESESRSGERETRSREETGDAAQSSSGTTSAGALAAAPVVPRAPDRATLTGDWGGLRSRLVQSGVNVRADYVSESFAMVDGGLRRGDGYAQQVRGGVDVDLGKTAGWKGAIFHFTLNERAGVGVSSEVTGNRLPIQEVAGGNYAKLTEFTIEQKLLGDKLDLRMGYYAMGNDLGGMALGCNLVNAAFCAHPLSMSGDTGWYNYPNARWGVTIRYRLLKELTVRTGINQVNPDLSLRRNGFKPFAGDRRDFWYRSNSNMIPAPRRTAPCCPATTSWAPITTARPPRGRPEATRSRGATASICWPTR